MHGKCVFITEVYQRNGSGSLLAVLSFNAARQG